MEEITKGKYWVRKQNKKLIFEKYKIDRFTSWEWETSQREWQMCKIRNEKGVISKTQILKKKLRLYCITIYTWIFKN